MARDLEGYRSYPNPIPVTAVGPGGQHIDAWALGVQLDIFGSPVSFYIRGGKDIWMADAQKVWPRQITPSLYRPGEPEAE